MCRGGGRARHVSEGGDHGTCGREGSTARVGGRGARLQVHARGEGFQSRHAALREFNRLCS